MSNFVKVNRWKFNSFIIDNELIRCSNRSSFISFREEYCIRYLGQLILFAYSEKINIFFKDYYIRKKPSYKNDNSYISSATIGMYPEIDKIDHEINLIQYIKITDTETIDIFSKQLFFVDASASNLILYRIYKENGDYIIFMQNYNNNYYCLESYLLKYRGYSTTELLRNS